MIRGGISQHRFLWLAVFLGVKAARHNWSRSAPAPDAEVEANWRPWYEFGHAIGRVLTFFR